MEMSRVAQRLCQPSADLVDWVAEDSVRPEKATEWLTKLLDFETADNLGSVDEKENKARRFKLSTKVNTGIIRRHLTEFQKRSRSAFSCWNIEIYNGVFPHVRLFAAVR